MNRDLQSYAPRLSSAQVRAPRRLLRFGRWTIPLSKRAVDLHRKSKPCWTILGEHEITSTILRVPITIPAEEFNGRLLSAMCTPDLRGTQGSLSWFSTRTAVLDSNQANRQPLRHVSGALLGELEGPGQLTVPFRLSNGSIEISGSRYPIAPRLYTLDSCFVSDRPRNFLLLESGNETTIYATPVQIDPENPGLPISHPRQYGIYLSKLLGLFATVGMAEDTWALNEGVIDEDDFWNRRNRFNRNESACFSAHSSALAEASSLRVRHTRSCPTYVLPLSRRSGAGSPRGCDRAAV